MSGVLATAPPVRRRSWAGTVDDEPARLSTWGTDPLVLGALVDGRRDAEQVVTRPAAEPPGTAFISVLTMRSLDTLGPVLEALDPVSAERVFTAGAPHRRRSRRADQARTAVEAEITPAAT